MNTLIGKVGQKLKVSYRTYILGALSAILLVVALLLLFRGPHLNEENLTKIKNGMTPQQVTSIIGKPSDSLTQYVEEVSPHY
jgi:outer membrane protein assembly factor BamE (lipoprotein component of BamABCDE complex)